MAYNIAIDARKLSDFGIGTYTRNLIAALGELDQENQYILFAGLQASQVNTAGCQELPWFIREIFTDYADQLNTGKKTCSRRKISR